MRELTLAELIDRHTLAAGGAALQAAIQTARLHGVMRDGDATVPGFTVLRKQPNLLRVQVPVPNGFFLEGYDGASAWEKESRAAEGHPVSGAAAQALWRATEWPGPLRTLTGFVARGHHIDLLEPQEMASVTYHVLRMTLTDGFSRDYFLHPQSYRIERTRDVRPLHPGQRVEELETLLDDFRQVDGIWLAFRERTVRREDGAELSAVQWNMVELNLDLPDQMFAIPVAGNA
jgi:hypothetical protein